MSNNEVKMTTAEGEKTLLEKYLEEIKALKCTGGCDKGIVFPNNCTD